MDINRFDYKEGDIVQLTKGDHTGKVGEIIGVMLGKDKIGLVYCVKLSDKSSCVIGASSMRLVRSS